MNIKSLKVILILAVLTLASLASSVQSKEGGASKLPYAALDELPDWDGIWTPNSPPFFMGGKGSPAFKGKYLEFWNKIQGILKNGGPMDEIDTRSSNCEPPAMPTVMIQPYNIQFTFSKDKIIVIQEAYMQVRRIFTDGRALEEDPDPTFNGQSTGHWEGDTLVVITNGLRDGGNMGRFGATYSDQLTITERIRLSPENDDILLVAFEFSDPKALKENWHESITFTRHREWEQIEFVCAENNRNPVGANGETGFLLEK